MLSEPERYQAVNADTTTEELQTATWSYGIRQQALHLAKSSKRV